MEQPQIEFDKQTIRQHPIPGKQTVPFAVLPKQAGEAAAFVRTFCFLCRRSFVFEVETQWNTPPEEMELEGRRFLGIGEDSVLCPECVADVEVAGAERMYWALSQNM